MLNLITHLNDPKQHIVFSHIILPKKCFWEQLLNYNVMLSLDLWWMTLRGSEDDSFHLFQCLWQCEYVCLCVFMRLFHTPLMQLSGTAFRTPWQFVHLWGHKRGERSHKNALQSSCFFELSKSQTCLLQRRTCSVISPSVWKTLLTLSAFPLQSNSSTWKWHQQLIRLSMTAVRFWPWRLAVATVFVFLPLAWVDILRRRRIYSFVFQPFVITRANQASHASNNTVTNTQRSIKAARNAT